MVDRAAYFSQGAVLSIGDGATPTEVFTPIPGVLSITGPGKQRDTIDVTSHSSPDAFREYIGGLRDSAEISFDMNYLFDDDAQALLDDAYDADDAVNFQILYPFTDENETDNFAGFVTDLSKTTPIDAQAIASVTIKITGPVTRTNDA